MVRFLLTVLVAAAAVSGGAYADDAVTVSHEFPYLCSGVLRDAQLATLDDGVIARCEDITVTRSDLESQITKLPDPTQQQARDYPVYVLDQHLTKQLTMLEAREWAKKNPQSASSDYQLIRSYLAAHTPKFEVSDKEAEDFYEEHSKLFGGSTYEQVKSSVLYFVRDQKAAEAENALTGSAGKRHKILVSDSWIRAEHARWSKNPVERARVSGKPSYVNFGVIGCCDRMHPVTESLRSEYGDRLNVVFVHTGQQDVLSDLYAVTTVPLQMLFDQHGKLLLRHQGNITKEQVVATFAESGIDLREGKAID
jgi:hypothetical protein